MKVKDIIKRLLSERVYLYLKGSLRIILSKRYRIIKYPNDCLEKVCKVREASWDFSYYPELYGHSKEQSLEIYCPEVYAFSIYNAVTTLESDAIITSQGVYWDKYNDEEFLTWAKPKDNNLAKYDKDYIFLIPAKEEEYIPGTTLCLIGLWSYHWAHFIFQYSGKLFYAGKNGLLNKEITILLSVHSDSNIQDIVNNYLKKYPKAKLKYAVDKVDYRCEKLICIPSTYPNFNDCRFRLDYKYIIPSDVVSMIHKYIVDPYVNMIKDNPTRYPRIFLPRVGLRRTLSNYNEVHDYFITLGFVDIECSNLSLEEKADIFYHAKEIVAISGASSQNFIFCNQARILMLSNYRFVNDACVYTQARENIELMIDVAGQDEHFEYHSNYYVPLSKIKKVYSERIKTDL